MEYLSRLSGLVSTPAKAAAGITGSPRLRKKPSLHPVGSVDVFHADWQAVQAELENPDERALFHGVARSDIPRRLQRIIDALVFENNRSNDGHTGPCMEYLLKYDILTELVHLSVDDRPKGVRGEVVRALKDLVILLDEKFLSRQAANKPISQLIQLCLDEDAALYQLDDYSFDTSGSSTQLAATTEDDYEEDLVDLMCHIASRIRNTPDLLQIFYSDEPVDDADDSLDARSLKDGSIIINCDLFEDSTSVEQHHSVSTPYQVLPALEDAAQRPPSPADSVDSTATIQPSTMLGSRKHSKRRLRFPLFSYLLKFVHREGRIGELARAGLLFLISLEGVQTSARAGSLGTKTQRAPKRVSFGTEDIRRSLAVFIAHSDFADVLGAGLGAAYGLLPSRIRPAPRYDPTAIDSAVSSKGGHTTITLASSFASESQNGAAASDALASATQSDDPELQAQLRLLVDLIEFCQDVLDSLWLASKHLTEGPTATLTTSNDTDEKVSTADPRSPSATADLNPMIRKLARAIAIAIRDTFIRNVVYPSLMESSDFDGSSAAVLNYLDVIIIVLRSGHILTDVALQFLLPADVTESLEEDHAYGIDVPADEADRYSVKDLILDSLEHTKRPATRVAALRLARSLIVCHGFRACSGLLQLETRQRITVHAEYEIPASPTQELEGTAAYTKVEDHFREIDTLSSLLIALGSTQGTEAVQISLSNYLLDAEQALRHDSTFSTALELGGGHIRLVRSDPFMQQLFDVLANFFSQPVEVNLAITGVLCALASSPVRSLEGWLTQSLGEQGDSRGESALVELLVGLAQQVAAYRDSVVGFDRYLAERRRSLVLTEDLSAALNVAERSNEGEASESSDSLGPSLTIPRISSHTGGGKLQTRESTRAAEREFGILEDHRSSLVSLASSPPASATVNVPEAEPASARSSALARLFGGSRPTRTSSSLGKRAPDADATTGRPGAGDRKVSASTINPYADHFRETAAVIVQTQPCVGAEPWRPAPTASQSKQNLERRATLSSVLDNTILLEELVKELLAVIQVRRAWAIDPVSFT